MSDVGRKQELLSRVLKEAYQQDVRIDDEMGQELGGAVNFLDVVSFLMGWYSLDNCAGLALEILDPFPKQITSKLQ